MYYFQAELIAKQKQQEIELKAKDLWKFHRRYEERNVEVKHTIMETRTPTVHSSGSCCTA
ncbi:hypothetical protein IM538_04220 [Cytobacillus suaedae]|nr:hypothetical protein IM538_04220 [Cytobacillus suaedae]